MVTRKTMRRGRGTFWMVRILPALLFQAATAGEIDIQSSVVVAAAAAAEVEHIFETSPFQNEDVEIDCVITLIHAYPERKQYVSSVQNQLKAKWYCVEENSSITHALEGDVKSFFQRRNGYNLNAKDRLHLRFPSSLINPWKDSIDLDAENSSLIKISEEDEGSRAIFEESENLFRGSYKLLVIRVVGDDDFVKQSEAKLHDDFFEDGNNLVRTVFFYFVDHII
jgi:hypothetical protein